MSNQQTTRREFIHRSAAIAGAFLVSTRNLCSRADENANAFRLNYILGSPMYGTAPLAEVLPEAEKIGATHIDVWRKPHADHVEQVQRLGVERAAEMLDEYNVKLGVVTRYDLKPATIHEGLPLLKSLGGKMLITGAGRGQGDSPKARAARFLETMKPQVEKCAEAGVVLGIENHANTLLHSPDSIRWFAELNDSPHIGLAMAPYHLPQDAALIAALIRDVGPGLVFFQGWEHGMGCMNKLPKAQEMLQMPGRGSLDFRPIVAALRAIDYAGWTEIFMHPVPRGVPIRETTAEVTEEINRARAYLDGCIE